MPIGAADGHVSARAQLPLVFYFYFLFSFALCSFLGLCLSLSVFGYFRGAFPRLDTCVVLSHYVDSIIDQLLSSHFVVQARCIILVGLNEYFVRAAVCINLSFLPNRTAISVILLHFMFISVFVLVQVV